MHRVLPQNNSPMNTESKSPALRIPANWPFAVNKWPFFYGWVVWLISTLGFLMSIPGQTMGMAVFTEPFINAFDLSRTQLSIAYMLGTLASALFLTRAGRLYDRLGARLIMVGSSVALAIVLLYFTVLDRLAAHLVGTPGVMFLLIMLGYFGVRFSGQGVLTSASRNVLMNWFARRRGRASGLRGVFVSLGFSLAPLVLAGMIGVWGWQGALWVMAAVVSIGFSSVVLVFLRDNPHASGLLPDGEIQDPARPAAPTTPSRSLSEARRDPVFWIYAGSISFHALFSTGMTFHVVAVFAEVGRSSTEAFGYFFPAAMASTSVNLLASWLSDRRPMKPFLIAMLLLFLVGASGLIMLRTPLGYALLVVGLGGGGGLWAIISSLAFVRLYGLLHIGEISGLNASLVVLRSAFGPALFSLAADSFGGYYAAYWICVPVLVLLIVLAIAVPQREPGFHSAK